MSGSWVLDSSGESTETADTSGTGLTATTTTTLDGESLFSRTRYVNGTPQFTSGSSSNHANGSTTFTLDVPTPSNLQIHPDVAVGDFAVGKNLEQTGVLRGVVETMSSLYDPPSGGATNEYRSQQDEGGAEQSQGGKPTLGGGEQEGLGGKAYANGGAVAIPAPEHRGGVIHEGYYRAEVKPAAEAMNKDHVARKIGSVLAVVAQNAVGFVMGAAQAKQEFEQGVGERLGGAAKSAAQSGLDAATLALGDLLPEALNGMFGTDFETRDEVIERYWQGLQQYAAGLGRGFQSLTQDFSGSMKYLWDEFKKDPARNLGKMSVDAAFLGYSAYRLFRAYCFPAGTPVLTSRGLKPIEAIGGGEQLWAFDPSTGAWGLKPVVEPLARRYQGPMVKVEMVRFVRGEEAKRETLEATGDHPFWVLEGQGLANRPKPKHIPIDEPNCVLPGRWVDAIDLREGDALLARDGVRLRIDKLDVRAADEMVYNAHVADWHTFAVGELGVLVHNSRKAPGGAASKNSVTELEVGKAGDLARRSAKDGLSPDHIPSFAAVKKSIEDGLKRALNPKEVYELRNRLAAIIVKTKSHMSKSPSYGGRNSTSKITKDARNLKAAFEADWKVWRKQFLAEGFSQVEIDWAYEVMDAMNMASGLY